MPTTEQRTSSLRRAVTASLGVAVLVLGPATQARATVVGAGTSNASGSAATARAAPAPAPAPAPQLSIAVDDGRTSAASGDTLTYAVTIHNLGTAPLTALNVTQSMPAGSTFGSADSAGVVEAGSVTWHVDLGAAASTTVHSTMSVTATPKELLRLATVACASVAATAPPLVCATHSDLLPAGRQAAASKTAAGSRSAPSSTDDTWYIGGFGGLVAVLGGTALLMFRRRKVTR